MKDFFEDVKFFGLLIFILFLSGIVFYWVLAYNFILLFSSNPPILSVSIFALFFMFIIFSIINLIIKDFDSSFFILIVISIILFFILYDELNAERFYNYLMAVI